jgi:hypothetical protein
MISQVRVVWFDFEKVKSKRTQYSGTLSNLQRDLPYFVSQCITSSATLYYPESRWRIATARLGSGDVLAFILCSLGLLLGVDPNVPSKRPKKKRFLGIRVKRSEESPSLRKSDSYWPIDRLYAP